jgi:hypothetical protein
MSGLDRTPIGDLYFVKAIDLESLNKFEALITRLHCFLRRVARWACSAICSGQFTERIVNRIASSAPARESYKRRESFCVYRQV